MRHVLDVVDEFTPDLKLESATGTPTPWDAHAETYQVLEEAGKAVAVKAVVGADTPPDEVAEAAAFAAEHLPSAPFVIQPVTPHQDGRPPRPTMYHLYHLHDAAGRVHPDVRIIPQVHVFLGAR